MIRRLKYDLLYIENMSLFVDFQIMIYTVITVFRKENIFLCEDGCMLNNIFQLSHIPGPIITHQNINGTRSCFRNMGKFQLTYFQGNKMLQQCWYILSSFA